MQVEGFMFISRFSRRVEPAQFPPCGSDAPWQCDTSDEELGASRVHIRAVTMDSPNQPPEPPPAGHSTMIPIAQIDPGYEQLAESSIRATITLVWPYSSLTKSFSSLLAEPDVRLRRPNGQVKVTFHGLVAERIAKTHVGIGDEVVLDLAGCRLEKNDTAAQTPGRYVAWDVHFDDRVHLQVILKWDILSYLHYYILTSFRWY